MRLQLPTWLSGVIIAAVAIAAVCFLGISTRPSEEATLNKSVPTIDGTQIDGTPFHLADYKGKVVMLNFWATWCGPCRAELPDLVELQQKYSPQGFTIIGLSDDGTPAEPIEETNAKVSAFTKQAGMTYPNLLIPEGVKSQFGIEALPTTFLIDKEGKVVFASAGMIQKAQIAQEIEKLLK